MRIGIAGYGFVGQAHHNALNNYYDILISDPDKGYFEDLRHADAIIVCVSTPPTESGGCDMSNVFEVLDNAPNVPILIKSTISLEGWDMLRDAFPNHDITFSPEFLRAATALEDFANTKEMLMGGDSMSAWAEIFITAMGKINVRYCPPRELILAKYFRNTFLATKVAFFNQMYDLCDATGLDFDHVRRSVGEDERIGNSHTQVTQERGFGGHCFPKDTEALVKTAQRNNVELSILEQAISYNKKIRKD